MGRLGISRPSLHVSGCADTIARKLFGARRTIEAAKGNSLAGLPSAVPISDTFSPNSSSSILTASRNGAELRGAMTTCRPACIVCVCLVAGSVWTAGCGSQLSTPRFARKACCAERRSGDECCCCCLLHVAGHVVRRVVRRVG